MSPLGGFDEGLWLAPVLTLAVAGVCALVLALLPGVWRWLRIRARHGAVHRIVRTTSARDQGWLVVRNSTVLRLAHGHVAAVVIDGRAVRRSHVGGGESIGITLRSREAHVAVTAPTMGRRVAVRLRRLVTVDSEALRLTIRADHVCEVSVGLQPLHAGGAPWRRHPARFVVTVEQTRSGDVRLLSQKA